MVVAHAGEHAAQRRRAGEVAVAEGVAGAVDAGTLAVPDAEDAVIFRVAEQARDGERLTGAPGTMEGGRFTVTASVIPRIW